MIGVDYTYNHNTRWVIDEPNEPTLEDATRLFDVDRKLVAFQCRWERVFKVHLNTFCMQFLSLLLVRIVVINPFSMNDVVRHYVVLQDLGERPFPER